MKKILDLSALFMGAALLLGGCAANEPAPSTDVQNGYLVSFRMNTRPSTRSASPSFEERILPESLHGALVDNDGLLATFAFIEVSDPGNEGSASRDILARMIPFRPNMTLAQLQARKPRLMIVANTPGMVTGYFNDDIGNPTVGIGSLRFSFRGIPDDNFRAIPMWGASTVDLSGLRNAETLDLGSIDLLRAMAKIEIALSDDPAVQHILKNVRLKSLTINGGNSRGFVTPANWNKTANTAGINFENALRAPRNSRFDGADTYYADPEGKSVTVYIPEYDNPDLQVGNAPYKNRGEIWLELAFTTLSGEKSGEIRFCPYGTDGKPLSGARLWDIVRNHNYRYELTSLDDSDFKFRVKIEDMKKGGDWYYEYD